MALFKCTICGGELEVFEKDTFGICPYCDSKNTIPREFDKRGHLFNRANFLRQNNEFDQAIEVYEDILKNDSNDAEAYYGLLLSYYGIEYVHDPKTGRYVPTCHRTHREPILSNANYKAAVDLASPLNRQIYIDDVAIISEIQKQIISLSGKQEPFDIFISYKETGPDGKRTESSVIAQDLYYKLTEKGYRVFYARKTLESRLGSEYEAIIFSALSSAKVLIALAAHPDELNAVWVRNEWSRFLEFAQENKDKTIIPAYKNFSPYDLPTELTVWQALNMGNIGFIQDLYDALKRLLAKSIELPQTQAVHMADQSASPAASPERMIKNGETFLSLGDYDSAYEIYSSLTKTYPEAYKGWWGLILCETKGLTQPEKKTPQVDKWYGYVLKLANDDISDIKRAFSDYEMEFSRYSDVCRAAEEYDGSISALQNEIKQLSGQKSDNIAAMNRLSSVSSEESLRNETYNREIEFTNLKNKMGGKSYRVKAIILFIIAFLFIIAREEATIGIGVVIAIVTSIWVVRKHKKYKKVLRTATEKWDVLFNEINACKARIGFLHGENEEIDYQIYDKSQKIHDIHSQKQAYLNDYNSSLPKL